MSTEPAPEAEIAWPEAGCASPADDAEPDWLSFSVVIPTYQRRDVVCEAVRALGRVDYPGTIELIVVVDGSIDGTADALTRIACPFTIRIVVQQNAGASAARNRGASEATNDVILFLDDDMMCDPNLLEQHAKMLRDGADAVIGDTPIHPDSPAGFLPHSVARWIASIEVSPPLSPFDIFSGQLSIRRTVFDEIGGFDESFTNGRAFANEDADLGVRLLAGFDVRYNPNAITWQRYVVTPREYMDRAAKAAEGDLHFISKHPQLSRDLLNARGLRGRLTKYLYIPLGRFRLLSRFLTASSVWAAEAALATPFRSNRILARYYSGSRSVAFWAGLSQRLQLPGRERLLVLCYHAIRDRSADPVLAPYGIAPHLFARQLDYLSSAGFTFVGADAVANFVQHGAPLPRRAVLLTFDDCYEELLEVARDVLQPRDIPALAFAVTGMKSGTNEWDQAFGAGRQRLLAPGELKRLASLGFEIGSHSRSHRDMTTLNETQQTEEASGSAADLVGLGLPTPRFFAYPFGAVDARSERAARSAGYVAAFGCRADYVTARSNRLDLPRVLVLASDQRWRFRAKAFWPRKFEELGILVQAAKKRVGMTGKPDLGAR